MDKDVFHNQLALSLGYEKIVYCKRINIIIDDKENSEDPKVIIKIDGMNRTISFYASETTNSDTLECIAVDSEWMKTIFDAVRQAYTQAMIKKF